MGSRPRRVLLVSGVYPPQIGGPAAQTKSTAEALAARGVESEVLTEGSSGGEGAGPVPVRRVIAGTRRRGVLGKIDGNLRMLREVEQVVRRLRPDVIHAQTVGYLSLYAAWAGRLHGIPTLLKYSGSSVAEGLNGGAAVTLPDGAAADAGAASGRVRTAVLRARERLILRSFDRIWVTTPRYHRELAVGFGVEPRKLWLHPNFIDLVPFEAVARAREQPVQDQAVVRLLVVSRLKPHKGVHVAIEALAHLPADRYVLRIAGNGPPAYEELLRRRAEELGVSPRVRFLGAVDPEHVHRVYRDSDLFLLPSYEEAFGIVLLEAMASGVPVVASRVGGIPEVVEEGISASLVPPGDARALADAVRELGEDGHKYASRVAAGRARASRYSLEQGTDALVQLYQSLRS